MSEQNKPKHDVTLDESYRLGRAAGYEQGWADAEALVNARWERELRKFADAEHRITQLLAAQNADTRAWIARLRATDGLTIADLWPGEQR